MTNNNNNKDSVASYMGPGAKGPFYCNYCNRKLDCLNQDTGEWVCTYCNIPYFPNHQNVKRPNKFETPDGQDKPLLTAVCPETWTKKKEDKLPEVFEALKAIGFKWTSFEER